MRGVLRLSIAMAVIVATCAAAEPARSDVELEKALVGVWRPASSREGSAASPAALTYFADHTFKLMHYSNQSCAKVVHEASGTWLIREGQLYTETQKSAGNNTRLRAGTRTRDKVVSVTSESMSLIDSRGSSSQRVKGSPCPEK
jgi:hypothetical protein